jgi:hypothetical protein
MIEARLGHSLDTTLPEEIADLRSIWNSLKDGATKAGEWFGGVKAPLEASAILDDVPAPEPVTKKPRKAEPVAPPVEVQAEPVEADIFG